MLDCKMFTMFVSSFLVEENNPQKDNKIHLNMDLQNISKVWLVWFAKKWSNPSQQKVKIKVAGYCCTIKNHPLFDHLIFRSKSKDFVLDYVYTKLTKYAKLNIEI